MSWSDDLLHSLIPPQHKEDIKDYDDLTDVEKASYKQMLELVEGSALTVDKLKEHIQGMRYSVEFELAKLSGEDEEKNVFLKARLLNYILLESFFTSPERAKQTLQFLVKRGKV